MSGCVIGTTKRLDAWRRSDGLEYCGWMNEQHWFIYHAPPSSTGHSHRYCVDFIEVITPQERAAIQRHERQKEGAA